MTGRRIAVIGGGISGLTAGYVLSRTDRVTLFEADRRLGGHADTHLVGPVPVDTGFIVYNERTYPLLTRLFAELGVRTRAAEMSMSVRCAGCGLHYAGQRGLGGLAADTRHPNYFGDFCMWWGVFLIALGSWAELPTVIAPLLMTYILTRGTGERLTDRRMAATRPQYAAYAARTSGFIPLPPRVAREHIAVRNRSR